jgi:hypothetical protein
LHNAALWPLQVLTLAAGLIIILLVARRPKSSARWLALLLAISTIGELVGTARGSAATALMPSCLSLEKVQRSGTAVEAEPTEPAISEFR